jgi:hypothetical protein
MIDRVTVRWKLATTLSVIGLVLAPPPLGIADPSGDPPPNPYPNWDMILNTYNHVDPADYFAPGTYGVFFQSPTGLNCGIWTRGSFGCGGILPGLPPGANHIGWNNGDTIVHYDLTVTFAFPAVPPGPVLPPHSYINWNETMCATLGDGSTYCKRGEYKLLITADETAFSPSWALAQW